jgi:hypothetical protein
MIVVVIVVVGVPSTATATTKRCGSFSVPGLLTRVHVRVVHGPVLCNTARHVMKKLFNGGPNRTIEGWHCIGPQTGYAACNKQARRFVATF